ncbi:phosphoribosylformylglycinamidine cyclo-ligase [Clostridium rectalis]|uniref:phosphoribosylformylglycinamidine cyclo-ligase n=1 Tax=Clostridium rectalis TaxID=2040295 RepID=UPI000F63EB04|nr:phosphoribosylformylglycinamidine cyclo-ligase [Clostridium rectalis]
MITYKECGVNIDEGYKTVSLMKQYTESTNIPGVLNKIGSFAGMFELKGFNNPVLVAGTDGVGTKLEIAFKMRKYHSIGIDCVAMCVNDILCQGAKPLFFLDYIACGKLKSEIAADIVKGVSEGCIMADCALIGGETAEMPGFYENGKYDIAGFAVGAVEKEKIITGERVESGDVLIGIASSGIHSNGYSLVRKIIEDLNEPFDEKTIGEEILTPTRIYVKSVSKILEKFHVKAMAHITGGGFYENIPRMFSKSFTAVIHESSFPVPKIFKYLMDRGVEKNHMFNTFNMGIGFVICVDEEQCSDVIRELIQMGEKAYRIGYVKKGPKVVTFE